MDHKGLYRLAASFAAIAWSVVPLAVGAGAQVGSDDAQVVGPGPAEVDVFHPERRSDDAPLEPLYGGRAIVHLASMAENLNYAIENSAVTRRMLYEVHAALMLQDWEYHDYRPEACESYEAEDMLSITTEAAAKYPAATVVAVKRLPSGDDAATQARQRTPVLYGDVTREGDAYVVTPVSRGNPLQEAVRVPAEDVLQLDEDSVFTFRLREGVRWHPSLVYEDDAAAQQKIADQTLDARDVHFSWSIYGNQEVDCDEKRFQFEKMVACEIVDDLTVRIFHEGQYAFALSAIGTTLTLLPSHIYNLSDPDNPAHDPDATSAEQARHINENPHNQLWVGLGPYRVTEFNQQWIQAERFTDADGRPLYYDLDQAGYFDIIRWRLIDDDSTAFSALLNGELDYFERVKSSDYFGEATSQAAFTDKFYKGYKYLGQYGFTCWNMYRPHLADLAVRKAIAHAFDSEAYRITNYKGLAHQVTGPFPYNSAAYNHDVKPLAYDPEEAMNLLEDAEWFDTNGDGVRDKDGVELVIDFLYPSGNDASKNLGLKLQESLAEVEIKLNLSQMEWATFLDKLKSRDFDAANLAWVPELESDPEQLWGSEWGEFDRRSSNNAGVQDPHIDALIAQGQRELDHEKRQRIWQEMHRYLYEEVQPYLFGYNVPNKFAMSKKIRGFQAVAIDPGYIIRRWHYVDPSVPGTRRTLAR